MTREFVYGWLTSFLKCICTDFQWWLLPGDLFTGVPRDSVGHGEEPSGSGEEEADTGPRTDRSAGGDILFYFESHICCRLLLLFS